MNYNKIREDLEYSLMQLARLINGKTDEEIKQLLDGSTFNTMRLMDDWKLGQVDFDKLKTLRICLKVEIR